ncbi:MAG: tetratricopeptide repeat protein [Planctomycetota bacterium]
MIDLLDRIYAVLVRTEDCGCGVQQIGFCWLRGWRVSRPRMGFCCSVAVLLMLLPAGCRRRTGASPQGPGETVSTEPQDGAHPPETSEEAPVGLEAKKAEILKLMATVPKGLHCGTGIPWYAFESKHHDDLTVSALRDLYTASKDEVVRKRALGCLSHQKRPALVPLWQAILKDRDENVLLFLAIRGLGAIDSQESNRLLLDLLSAQDTPGEGLVWICRTFAEQPPREEALKAVLHLTSHESDEVRVAAFKASLKLGADRPETLKKALADRSASVLRFALRSLGPNPSDDFISAALGCLANPDSGVHSVADQALRYVLSDAARDRTRRLELLRKALEEDRWNYKTAPLLTSRYALMLENAGHFAEAAKAYKTAQEAYASDLTYGQAGNDDPGATLLYRLLQVKRKTGDLDGARAVLRRLVKEYPGDTRVYARDFPSPGTNMQWRVDKLAARLEPLLTGLPIAITVASVKESYTRDEKPQFRVCIRNVTKESLVLHCTTRRGKDVLVPACRPSIVMNGRGWMDFDETVFLSKEARRVTLAPQKPFSFVGTLSPIGGKGTHVLDFRLKPTCELKNGTEWSQLVLTNSVTVVVE